MKASMITESELVILSLVAEKPVYGYEIEQIIESRGMREWTAIGFSSIYYLLKKIEEKGWVVGKPTFTKKKGLQRNIYNITVKGKKICQEETIKALSEPQAIPNAFLVGLSNLPLLNNNQINTALIKYRDTLAAKKKELVMKKESQAKSVPLHVISIFEFSIKAIQSDMDWIDDFIHQYVL